MQISAPHCATLPLLCLVAIVACNKASPNQTITPGAHVATGDECANYNGPFYGTLRGSLLGKRDRARKVARRIQDIQDLGKNHHESGGNVTLSPFCEHHDLDRGDLKSGRFVGVLTGPGTYPRFSVMPNDIVAWWVFGESAKTQGGKDTTIWHSQFLSLLAPANSVYLKNDLLLVCEYVEKGGKSEEEVGWHGGACSNVPHTLSGHKPWFGCKLGCCTSSTNLS